MTAKIHLERMMHRNNIAVPGESAASYALIKLIPSGLGVDKPMGLNLALVLDLSGSMYEEDDSGVSRLQRVQQAAIHALGKLKPDDTMAVIGFANNALVLLPATPLSQKQAIEDVINRLYTYDIDPGGTSMDEGISLGLAEVEKNARPGTVSQLLVLTDGETSGEQKCRELAQEAADKKIALTMMGVGTDWNANLLKDLAKNSKGKWYYIDDKQEASAERIFDEEFKQLAASAFTNVEMHVRPMKDIRVKRVRQVVPEIKELILDEQEERHLMSGLGTLTNDSTTRYIIDMSLPKRPDGKYVVAQVEVTYDAGTGKRETTGPHSLEMTYTAAGQGYVNAEVAKHIDEVQIYEMNQNLQKAIASENQDEVLKVAKQIEKKGEVMGPRAAKKTMLARQALQELNAEGRVSKKTQLAVDDAARMAAEMPAG